VLASLIAISWIVLFSIISAEAEGLSPASAQEALSADPSPSRGFIVSLSFRLSGSQLRSRKKRLLLVAKVERFLRVHKGWGVALKAGETSIRPEIFWRGSNTGGWNTFEKMKIVPNMELFLSIVVRPRETITVYLQDPSLGDGTPTFLGGAPIGEAGTPRTAGELTASKGVSKILIASPEILPKGVVETGRFLDGGPSGVRGRLSAEELNLWRD